MILAKEVQDRINALRANNITGASSLAEEAGSILIRVVDLSRTDRPEELRSRVLAAGKAVIKAQPAMAPIYTLVNDVLAGLGQGGQWNELGTRIKERTRSYVGRLHRATESAAGRAVSLIQDGSTVVTHSRSSVVEKALVAAAKEGKTFSVICTESRPMMEGRALAERLGSAGIPTVLVVEAAVGSLLRKETQVLVGADALSVHGLVNKVGTSMIALAARAVGAPFGVIATTQRFLPPTVPLSYQEIKSPREIVGAKKANVTVVNLYFDLTPLDHVTTCVTESEVLDLKGLHHQLTNWRVLETLDLEACG